MNTIEQQLKSDAQAFKQRPKKSVHDAIMTKIKQVEVVEKKSIVFKWLLPSSSAIAALVLLVMNINPEIKQQNHHQKINPAFITMYDFRVDLLPLSIENQLTNDLKNEQIALVKDVQYIKSLISIY